MGNFLTSTGDLVPDFSSDFFTVVKGSSAAAQRHMFPSNMAGRSQGVDDFLIKKSRPGGISQPKSVLTHEGKHYSPYFYSLILTFFTNVNYISSATILNFIKQTNLLLDLFGSSIL